MSHKTIVYTAAELREQLKASQAMIDDIEKGGGVYEEMELPVELAQAYHMMLEDRLEAAVAAEGEGK